MKYRNLKVAFSTLGCKSNRYDTIKLQEILKHYPIEIVEFEEKADLYIINTCAVTNNSEIGSRKLIRKAKRTNNNADVLVTGCYTQIAKDYIQSMDEVSFVIENTRKNQIAKFIKNHFFSNLPDLPEDIDYIAKFSTQTRPFIKIQDGCKAFCSYCVIPQTRPVMKSLEKEKIAKQINILSDQGYKEVVLTGIHVGYYGYDLKNTNLIDLLKYLDKHTRIDRIRISSIDPHEITKEFVDIIAESDKFQNQLHIALQYADDRILKLMKRDYNTQDLLNNISYANKKIKNLMYGFDIIIGFPGEDEDSFNNNLKILKQLTPGYMHVFPYSKRPLTTAIDLKNHVNGNIIKERARITRELAMQLKKERIEKALGTKEKLLIERKIIYNNKTYFRGHSSNFFEVLVEKSKNLSDNIIVDVKLIERLENNMIISKEL